MNNPKNVPGTGKGMGRGGGQGRMGGIGKGPGGSCICPNCNSKVTHERGVPCFEIKCPNCGTTMTRVR